MALYINFNEKTGKIVKLTNVFDDTTPSIEVDRTTYVDFISGKTNTKDYLILPTGKENIKYELQLKHSGVDLFDVDRSIHRVEKVTSVDNNNAFIIIQNTVNKTWSFKLTDGLKNLLQETPYYKDKEYNIYITSQDDPNILLDTIHFQLWNVMYNDKFVLTDQNKEVASQSEVSVYCGKIFENYYHIQETE
jgi:hypothetical protein